MTRFKTVTLLEGHIQSGVQRSRASLLSCTALASGLILGSLVVASSSFAADQSGGNGTDNGPELFDNVVVPPIGPAEPLGGINVDPATLGPAVAPAGGNGGNAVTPTAAGPGAAGAAGGGAGGDALSANGTGGNGANGGIGQGGGAVGVGTNPITVDITGDIVNPALLNLVAKDGTGGNGGIGGIGTGANNSTAIGGAGGVGTAADVGGTGGPGGAGGFGGDANGSGGNGGEGGNGVGGSIAAVSVSATGSFNNGITIAGTGGIGTGGTGGLAGAGNGGTGGKGGAGGAGGGLATPADGHNTVGGTGGNGGFGGDANGTGGTGGDGGDGSGGNVGAITVAAGGAINGGVTIDSTGGLGTGGNANNGGNGTGGTGGAGGNGGAGGGIGDMNTGGDSNQGGQGGTGGSGGGAPGTGGNGGEGGMATGGDTGDIAVTAATGTSGLIAIDSHGGFADAGDGGNGGNGLGGTAGAGGIGGAGGGIGTIAQGIENGAFNGDGNQGGTGGAGAGASGQGGTGGDGGDAFGGDSGMVNLTGISGDVNGNTQIDTSGGKAMGGNGGTGGTGTGKAGGNGGDGGKAGNIGAVGDAGVTNNNRGGVGGSGGSGGSSEAQGGNGGAGGDGTGGNAGDVVIARTGNTTGQIKVDATGGDGTGGNGGNGGIGTAVQAAAGGNGGDGGTVGTVAGGTGNISGDGGESGTGGGFAADTTADASGGNGGDGGAGRGGSANVSITNSGNMTTAGGANSIDITATGGAALGGNGGNGVAATAGAGGTGGLGGPGGIGGQLQGDGGAAGDGGNGGIATGGDGGDGGTASGGNATVEVVNSGDITTGGSAIHIVAIGGNATSGNGGAGGNATGGVGGTGGHGGTGGLDSGQGGAAGNGGNGGNAFAGDAGSVGAARGGSADVTVTNNGLIFGTGSGINIETTAGTATFGSLLAPGGGGAGGAGGQGDPGGGSVQGPTGNDGTAGTFTPGAQGTFDLANTAQGTSTIEVNNNNLVDVDGIGVRGVTHGNQGTITINNTSIVQGGTKGLELATDSSVDAFIANSDIKVFNTGQITADSLFAIDAKGASTEIDNAGTVLGRVNLTSQGDTFTNQAGGVFAARLNSDFGNNLVGTDTINNLGTINTAGDAAVSEPVSIMGLESLRNEGLITLVDGQAGDGLTISPTGPGATEYVGVNGRIAVDVVLAAPGTGVSDVHAVTGNVSGKTFVQVNVLDVQGAHLDGIPVVTLSGLSDETNVDLENGPINAGFFAWDLRYDGINKQHELFTADLGAGAFEFAAGITGAQDIWHQTTGTLLQRQADLRPLLGGTQATPAADYAEPVDPTPMANITPGFWIKGVGAWLDRDEGNDLTTTDHKQDIYGGLAGFDFGTESAGQAWMFGLFGGYLTSNLDFDETNTEWDYEGPSVGAYATYLDHAFHVDAIVKADFLEVDIDASDLAAVSGNTDTDVTNIGGRIDTGYKFGFGFGGFIEPQASLAVVNTEIDDTDIFGGTVEFDDETSVRGRLGLRLGFDHTGETGTVFSGDVTASVWEEFNGDNDVSIFAPGLPASLGASDDPGQTVGDVSLGFSVAAPEGFSGFLRGNYQFADDYEAVIGNAGVRYAW